MLRKKAIRKIVITTFVLFVVLTIYMIPTRKNKDNKIYRYIDTKDISVYLENNYNQLTKVDFKITNSKIENVIESIIKKLTISNDVTIPRRFKQIIPSNIILNKVKVDESIAYLSFSKEFLNIKDEDIEMIVEAISYSIFELKEINGVSIYVNDDNISNKYEKIPNIITKEYGINKRYEISSLNNLSKVTIFYLDNEDDINYYVPITKYVNDDREKIKIIIDELSSNYVYESNLISLLNKNSKLLNYEIKNDSIILDFNNSVFLDQNEILEEVVYSVFANYDVDNIVFKAEGKEIYKKKNKITWIIGRFAV